MTGTSNASAATSNWGCRSERTGSFPAVLPCAQLWKSDGFDGWSCINGRYGYYGDVEPPAASVW
ncbi:hypothetical protein [Streptomyces fodineus]|uniref:hypothetical protein n=1 Tax=Streptomyces fodineus TaxID=1904616 RepID=UPI00131B70F0|nr:hypothetical protein [Streptomyces fodineus]